MKLSLGLFLSFLLECRGVPFGQTSFDGTYHYPYEPFGVYKSAIRHDLDDDITKVAPASRKTVQEAKPKVVDELDPTLDYGAGDDFDEAEDAIFHAVETAEKAMLHLVEHAVEDEVDTFFHDLPHHEKKEKKERCFKEGVRECLEEMEHGDME